MGPRTSKEVLRQAESESETELPTFKDEGSSDFGPVERIENADEDTIEAEMEYRDGNGAQPAKKPAKPASSAAERSKAEGKRARRKPSASSSDNTLRNAICKFKRARGIRITAEDVRALLFDTIRSPQSRKEELPTGLSVTQRKRKELERKEGCPVRTCSNSFAWLISVVLNRRADGSTQKMGMSNLLAHEIGGHPHREQEADLAKLLWILYGDETTPARASKKKASKKTPRTKKKAKNKPSAKKTAKKKASRRMK